MKVQRCKIKELFTSICFFLLLLLCYYYYYYYYYHYYYYYSVLNINAISVIYFNTAHIKVLGCHLCASLDRYGWECLIC